ncbi:MAG TPA: alginate export family protein, partial [Kofleriaceae bacterium]
LRHTLGMRVRISESGYAGEVETAIQRGQISSTPVDAWLLGGELVAKIVTIGGGITSGDPGQGALGTFSPLSFRAAYFGYLAANGASNEIGVHAALNQALPRHVSVRAEVWEFWRQSLSDGVYGLTGALLRPAGPHDGRFMGTQAEALATWKPDRHITIGATVSQFYASALLRNTITYGATWITFGF